MIQIKFMTLEPLHMFGGVSGATLAGTYNYVPGTALRGALASAYRSLHNQDADFETNFQRWFLDPAVFFSPLLPRQPGTQETGCLPETAFTCKLYSGFGHNYRHHGVRDMLFEFLKNDLAARYATGAAELPKAMLAQQDLPLAECDFEIAPQHLCGAKLIHHEGFYQISEDRLSDNKISLRLETHTAVDSRSETAAAQQLFSLEVIEEKQYLGGKINLGDEEEEKVFVKTLLQEGTEYSLGGARSRGHGRMQVARETSYIPSISDTSPDRFKEFDRQARKGGVQAPLEGTIFAITLLSDCILRDKFMRYRTQLTAQDLAAFGHPTLANVHPLGVFCHTRLIEGWNDAHGLPRPTELAIAAGSVFAFHSPLDVVQLAPYLNRLQARGIGDRKQEGFGWIWVDHPFHLNRRPQ